MKTINGESLIPMASKLFLPSSKKLIEIKDSVYAVNNETAWGAVTLLMDTIIPFVYDYIGSYSNGYYLVTKNDSFNYIDNQGVILFKDAWLPTYPEYKILAKYTGKPVLVLTEKGYNYQMPDGKLVFKYAKESLSAYDSLIAFSKGDLWGYLSPDPPLEVIEPKYNSVKPFYNGCGIVSLSPYWGVIKSNDEPVIGFNYDDLKFLNDSLLLANKNGKQGVLTLTGDTLIPFIATEIELYNETIVSITTIQSLIYYNLDNNKWIRKDNE